MQLGTDVAALGAAAQAGNEFFFFLRNWNWDLKNIMVFSINLIKRFANLQLYAIIYKKIKLNNFYYFK